MRTSAGSLRRRSGVPRRETGTDCPAAVCVRHAELRGDLNCDGRVDFGDIKPYVQYVADFVAWRAMYPSCAPEFGDVDGDGEHACNGYAFDDINAFAALLSSVE